MTLILESSEFKIENASARFFDSRNQHSAAVICKKNMHDIFSEMAAEFFVECSLNVSYQKSIYPRIDCHLESGCKIHFRIQKGKENEKTQNNNQT